MIPLQWAWVEVVIKMPARKFDLNIEKILEDWEAYHAISVLLQTELKFLLN